MEDNFDFSDKVIGSDELIKLFEFWSWIPERDGFIKKDKSYRNTRFVCVEYDTLPSKETLWKTFSKFGPIYNIYIHDNTVNVAYLWMSDSGKAQCSIKNSSHSIPNHIGNR